MTPTFFVCAMVLAGCSVLCIGLLLQGASNQWSRWIVVSAGVVLLLNITALSVSATGAGEVPTGTNWGAGQTILWREAVIALQTLVCGLWAATIMLWFSNMMGKQRALMAAKEAALHSARTDSLTGLGNRHWFDQVVAHSFKYLRKQPTTAQPMLVLIDLDGLKRINDDHGHPAGDELLRTFAMELRGLVETHLQRNPSAQILQTFRLGGDEFALLATAQDEGFIREQLALIEQQLRVADPRFANTGVSFGTAHATKSGSFDDVLSHADTLMYAYKTARKSMH